MNIRAPQKKKNSVRTKGMIIQESSMATLRSSECSRLALTPCRYLKAKYVIARKIGTVRNRITMVNARIR